MIALVIVTKMVQKYETSFWTIPLIICCTTGWVIEIQVTSLPKLHHNPSCRTGRRSCQFAADKTSIRILIGTASTFLTFYFFWYNKKPGINRVSVCGGRYRIRTYGPSNGSRV